MGWGQAQTPAPGTLGARIRDTETIDLTNPHAACDRRIQTLEDTNQRLRTELARALTELGYDESEITR